MNTKERIVKLAESNGLTKQAILKKTGLRRGFLDTDKMAGAVSDCQLAAIMGAFPQVSVEWLITGEGAMYKPSVVLPPDVVSLDRHELLVRENERLRIELEEIKKGEKK